MLLFYIVVRYVVKLDFYSYPNFCFGNFKTFERLYGLIFQTCNFFTSTLTKSLSLSSLQFQYVNVSLQKVNYHVIVSTIYYSSLLITTLFLTY